MQASVFPVSEVLLVSQATMRDFVFTSFVLDALWQCWYISHISSSSAVISLIRCLVQESFNESTGKNNITLITSSVSNVRKQQIDMLSCSKGQNDQVRESDTVKGQSWHCYSAWFPAQRQNSGVSLCHAMTWNWFQSSLKKNLSARYPIQISCTGFFCQKYV